MSVKYRLDWQSLKGDNWRVDWDFPNYSGEPIPVQGDRNPLVISYGESASDDPFDNHLIPQSATVRVWDDNIDLYEIQTSADRTIRCTVYKNSGIKHIGFLKSDGVKISDSGVGSIIELISSDGLESAKDVPFIWANQYPLVTVPTSSGSVRDSLINVARMALYEEENIYISLPVCWSSSIRQKEVWSIPKEIFTSFTFGDTVLLRERAELSVGWVLENICKVTQTWLYQKDGKWFFENRRDTLKNGNIFSGWTVPQTIAAHTATTYSEDRGVQNVENLFIDGDQYWSVLKPIGRAEVTYPNITIGQNIILNGDFEQTWGGPEPGFPYWIGSGFANFEQGEPFTKRGEHSAFIQHSDITQEDPGYVISNAQTIDGHTLFDGFTMGFDIVPVTFPVIESGDNKGKIDWDRTSIDVRVRLWEYNNETIPPSDTIWYLNEFGFWTKILPVGEKMVQTDFFSRPIGPQLREFAFDFTGTPVGGETQTISYVRFDGTGTPITTTYLVPFDTQKSLLDTLIDMGNFFKTGPGGWWSVYYEYPDPSTIRMVLYNGIYEGSPGAFIQDQFFQEQDSGIDPEGFMLLTVPDLRNGDVASVAFTGKGGSRVITIPDWGATDIPGVNPSPSYRVQLDFRIGTHESMYLDNVYMQVEDNSDVYEVYVNGKNRDKKNYEIGLSSSFSSFFLSNISSADDQFFYYEDENYSCPMTEMYGRAVLEWRETPKRLFEGSIDMGLSIGDILFIKGIRYVINRIFVDSDDVSRITAIEAPNILPWANRFSSLHRGTLEKEIVIR